MFFKHSNKEEYNKSASKEAIIYEYFAENRTRACHHRGY